MAVLVLNTLYLKFACVTFYYKVLLISFDDAAFLFSSAIITLLKATKEVTDWKEFLHLLGLKDNEYEKIRSQTDYVKEIIVKWLDNGEASLAVLVAALRVIGKNAIADIIARTYPSKCTRL